MLQMTMTEIRLMQVRAGPGGLTSAKLNIGSYLLEFT